MLPDASILALVVQQTTNAVVITNGTGLIEWVNDAFTQVTGYELDEVRGRKPGSFLQGPGTDPAAVSRLRLAIMNGQSCSEELLNYRKSGELFWVALNISPICDEDGLVTHFVSVQSDVSQRRAAEAARRRSEASLRAVVTAMPLIIFAADRSGRLTLVEGMGLEKIGLTPGHALGRLVSDELGHFPEVIGHIKQAIGGESFVTLACVDRVVFEMRYSPLRDHAGELSGMLCVALDVTERVQATADLVRARDDAEAATKAKSAFLATMSHEIRTPLNAVIGMASLLLDTPMSEEQRRYAETIRTSGDMLLSVINDILDFSKIEAGNMELERQPFDPRSCVEEVIDLLAPRAAEKGLRLAAAIDFGVPERIVGDVTRVRQILVNLVGNAVKFTEHGEVLVRLVARPASSDGNLDLTIAVSDTGVGIPPDRLGRMFQPFSQVDASTTRRYGGTGLGLAICKRLCNLMGGSIDVQSIVGQGSTFTVNLPVGTAARARPRSEPRGEPQVGHVPLRILLAEDNSVNQQVALRMLERLGYRADLAANGLEVLQALRRQHYDVILMDVQMPEMDGLEATRLVRAELPSERQPRIVAMTAGAMVGDREACLAAGMDDYISKPVQREDLTAALRQARPVLPSTPMHALHDATLDETAMRRLRADLGTDFVEDLEALVATYRSQLRTDVATMGKAAASGDLRVVALLSHRLQGASATLGAQRAAQICRSLEAGGHSPAELAALIERLLAEGERAADALALLASASAGSESHPQPATRQQVAPSETPVTSAN